MGSGFVESVYEKCLAIELRKTGFLIDSQKAINVFYEGDNVGEFIADIIVNDTVILELKAVKQLAGSRGSIGQLSYTNRKTGRSSH